MAFYQFKRSQLLPADLQTVWDFISSPANLKEITPDYMGFEITSKGLPAKMHPGMIIRYRVRPLLGIATTWVTEITQVNERMYFVDEQRVGPYAMWHHQHHLEPVEGGVLMSDIISYRPPLGFLGALANGWLIRPKLEEIFDYRQQRLARLFPEPAPAT